MNNIRALSKHQNNESGFDSSEYTLNEKEGVFEGTLIIKRWGKKRNIHAFVDLDDGRKIMCTAFQVPGNYLGLPDHDPGVRLKLEFNRTRNDNIRLNKIDYSE